MPLRGQSNLRQAPKGLVQKLAERWAHYYDHPVDFAYEVIGIERLDQWQQDTLNALFQRPSAQVAVAAGTGVGKETVAALATLCFLATRKNSRVAAMSASESQLKNALWIEIHKWLYHGKQHLAQFIEWTPTRILVRGHPKWYAFQSTASKRVSKTGEVDAEAGAGLHGEHLLLIISEASGVDDVLWDAKLATMTDEGDDNRILAIGNPVRRSGRFYEIFKKEDVRKHWWVKNVSHAESSFVSKLASKRIADIGNAALTRAKVEGEFPDADDGWAIYRLDELLEANNRNIDDQDDPSLKLQIGIDVARGGPCFSVVYGRRGRIGLGYEKYQHSDLMLVVSSAVQFATRWWGRKALEGPRPASAVLSAADFQAAQRGTIFVIDIVGMGAGVYDALRAQGWTCKGIHAQHVPRNKKHYASRNDELWFVDGKIALTDCYVPHDDTLELQICARRMKYDRTGKRRVETKDEMMKRGLDSPDVADGFMLAFAQVVDHSELDYSRATSLA